MLSDLKKLCVILFTASLLVSFVLPSFVFAQTTKYQASTLQQKARIFASPASGSFIEGSTFEVPIYVDTLGKSINTIELHISFDPKKLTIVSPAGGKSIIGFWVSQPTYSNITGSVNLTGSIPNGVTTDSGLITTMTFKVIGLGDTAVKIDESSQIFANDGLGSQVAISFINGRYSLTPVPPQGVTVFSETHPSSEVWYNNPNPVFGWEKPAGITDFSYEFDDKPFTVPDNTSDGSDTSHGYEKVADGISYFHIKAKKNGVWGGTTHFAVRIDTHPPATFNIKYEFLTASVISNHTLLNFFTTDSLSGINHYEVGIIGKNDDPNQAPLYVQAASPYQIPTPFGGDVHVIVRAFDNAGNTTDSAVDIHVPNFTQNLKDNKLVILLTFIVLLLLALIIIHYFVGHHIIKKLKMAYAFIRGNEKEQPIAAPIPVKVIDAIPQEPQPIEKPEVVVPPPVPEIVVRAPISAPASPTPIETPVVEAPSKPIAPPRRTL